MTFASCQDCPSYVGPAETSATFSSFQDYPVQEMASYPDGLCESASCLTRTGTAEPFIMDYNFVRKQEVTDSLMMVSLGRNTL